MVTLEVSRENSQRVTTPFLQVTQNTLLLITGWKYDEVSSHSGLVWVRGQGVCGGAKMANSALLMNSKPH